MKKIIVSVLLLCVTFGGFAQNIERFEEVVIDTVPTNGKKIKGNNQKVITIRLKGDKAKEEKIMVEIDGSKIKVNGKDIADLKDIDVNIGENRIYFNRDNGITWATPNMDQRYADLNARYSSLEERRMDLDELMSEVRIGQGDKKRTLLGIGMEKVENGVKVTNVTDESGADKAGLKEGDIITKIDDKIIKTELDITKIVSANKPGAEINLEYLRDGKKKSAKAVLGESKSALPDAWTYNFDENKSTLPDAWRYNFDENHPRAQIYEMPKMHDFNYKMEGDFPQLKVLKGMPEYDGFTYFSNGQKLGLSLTETESGNGLEVTAIEDNSVAGKAGLQKGDIVTKVGETNLNTVADIKKAVSENKEKPFTVTYLRNGKEQKAEIKFPKELKEVSL